jgi:hypothetical protein
MRGVILWNKERGMIVRRLYSLMVFGLLLVDVLAGASVATALEVGERAPDFTLPGTTGKEISLSQFRGK